MLLAVFGLEGHSAATYAALATAYALAVGGRPATLVRVAGPSHGLLRLPTSPDGALRIVELPAAVGAGLDGLLAGFGRGDRDLILDLPLAWAADPDLSAAADLAVLAVGPGRLDERLVASALGRMPVDGDARPLWLLGCGRSGGEPGARRFKRTMRALLEREGPGIACRYLPVALPEPSRSEVEAVTDGSPHASTLAHGILLLAAVEVASSDPHAPGIDHHAFAEALGLGEPTAVTADQRRLCERLRDLADDLEALEREGPQPEDLAGAPLMEGWAFEAGRTRVITGVSHGHPNIPAGREVRTSDVFATDGRTWARTLSRWYRLGRPAVPMPGSGLQ